MIMLVVLVMMGRASSRMRRVPVLRINVMQLLCIVEEAGFGVEVLGFRFTFRLLGSWIRDHGSQWRLKGQGFREFVA